MPFACIFVPDFPVEAVVRAEPELREQAVAVVEGAPPLLNVVSVNEAARQAGVEVGMTKLQAQGRLSALTIRRRSPLQEAAAHAALIDCACAFSPRVEADPAMPDSVVLDLSGLERLFGPPARIARELAQRASTLGLETNVAVAANAETATYAARGFSGVMIIPPGTEAERLGLLPIEVLLSGTARHDVDTQAALLETLNRWGVRTFRALAALPETALHQRLGDAGVRWQRLARGEGGRPLVPSASPLRFEEAVELEHPVALLEPLAFVLNGMLENLCARLSARALSTNELRLRLGLDNACSEESSTPAQRGIEESQSGNGSSRIHSTEFEIENSKLKIEHELVLRLPVPMLDAKVFLKLLQLELRAKPPGAPVEKIFLAAEPVQPRFTQQGLFLPTAPEPERLELTLARIKQVVGSKPPVAGEDQSPDELRVGSAELLDTHRPDAFRMKPFAPPEATTTYNKQAAAMPVGAGSGISGAGMSRTALRRCRPPQPVAVETRNGAPAGVNFDLRILNFDLRSTRARFEREAIAKVTWAAGPWLESGDWWTESNWSREVWDVAIDQAGATAIYRIYHDPRSNQWFVDAMYD